MVRYLGSTCLPGPQRLLSLFEAATAEAMRTVSETPQVPAICLEAAIELPQRGRRRSRHRIPRGR